MMNHPTSQQLGSLLDGEVTAQRKQCLQEHVAACLACQTTLTQLQSMHQAIRATASTMPCLTEASAFVAALNRRIRRDATGGWRRVCFAAPLILALASIGAQSVAWVILSGGLLQKVGVVPQVGNQVSAWAVEGATAPLWQRMVYEPLGWSQQEVAAAVSQVMSPVQNDALRPLWAELIMVLPLTLLFGVGVLALSWFICWIGPSQRK